MMEGRQGTHFPGWAKDCRLSLLLQPQVRFRTTPEGMSAMDGSTYSSCQFLPSARAW